MGEKEIKTIDLSETIDLKKIDLQSQVEALKWFIKEMATEIYDAIPSTCADPELRNRFVRISTVVANIALNTESVDSWFLPFEWHVPVGLKKKESDDG